MSLARPHGAPDGKKQTSAEDRCPVYDPGTQISTPLLGAYEDSEGQQGPIPLREAEAIPTTRHRSSQNAVDGFLLS